MRLIRHYLPLLLLTVLTVVAFYFKNPKWDLITLIADSSGYLAIVLIAGSLMIGTVNILFKRRNPNSTYFRRDIGITAGVITELLYSFYLPLVAVVVVFQGIGVWKRIEVLKRRS